MAHFDNNLSRRDAVKIGLGAGVALGLGRVPAFALPPSQGSPLIQRAIPSSGEMLPVVGIGTARNYENPDAESMARLKSVLAKFAELGGRVVDTAPAYGSAETVVGQLLSELKTRDKTFLATKVSIRGAGTRETAIAQMEASMKRLQTDHIDLMQVWNLSSPDIILPLLEEWKAAKKIRYIGVTTSSDGQYPALEELMKKYKLDFIQADLAINNRNSQDRLLPLAADRGIGVLVDLPFGRSSVFTKTLSVNRPLPDWAREIDVTSWPQLFLKYIVSNPAVTTVIPGTERVEFVIDNLGAARGRLPDAAMRKHIEAYFDAL
jgi:aryl-alcohol dehydrogenase-like predicted oxidoreductase